MLEKLKKEHLQKCILFGFVVEIDNPFGFLKLSFLVFWFQHIKTSN